MNGSIYKTGEIDLINFSGGNNKQLSTNLQVYK